MTTTPDVVEAAKKFAEVGPANISDHSTWWKAATELAPHKCAEKQESIYEACIRILAARVRELERERMAADGPICKMCGNYFGGHATGCHDICDCHNNPQHPQPEQAKEIVG